MAGFIFYLSLTFSFNSFDRVFEGGLGFLVLGGFLVLWTGFWEGFGLWDVFGFYIVLIGWIVNTRTNGVFSEF